MSSALIAALFAPAWVGRRAVLVATMLVLALTTAIVSAMPSFTLLQGAFAIFGFGFVIVKIAAYETIGEVADDPRRHTSLVILAEAVFTAGSIGGIVVFAGAARANMLSAYSALAVLSLLAAGAAMTLPAFATAASPTPGATLPGDRIWRFLRMMPVLAMLVATFAYVLSEQAITASLRTVSRESLGLEAPKAILVAALFAICMATGRAVAAMALRRVAASRVLIVSGAGLFLLLGGAAIASWFGVRVDAALLLPPAGLFLAPLFPILNAAVLARLPREDHGALVGLSIIAATIGGTFGAVATGALLDRGTGDASFAALLIPLGLVIAIALRLLRPSRTQASPCRPAS